MFLVLFTLSFNFTLSQEKVILKGKILDLDSKESLKAVTVRNLSGKGGVFTNNIGEFSLKCNRGINKIRFTMVGHESQEIEFKLENDTTIVEILMHIAKLSTEDVIVYAEDPATRFMRKVIAKKLIQKDSLLSYTYMLYTKFVVATDTLTAGRTDAPKDTTINSILESYSKGYYKAKDNYFNEIIQKRQSVNVPPEANFVSFGTNINAYDDIVSILNQDIYSPFHPDAIDFYKYEFVGYFKSDIETKILRVKVTPKTDQRRLFEGYINIDEVKLVPVSVELVPNIAVQLPFDAKLNYNQDFEIINSKYVLPTRMRIYSTLKAELFWIIAPRLDILIETAAFDYETNIKLSNDLFSERRVEASETADIFDVEFWRKNELVPLRAEEELAFDQIRKARDNPDSVAGSNLFTQYLAPINRFFVRFTRAPFTGIDDLLKYNRVWGPYLGLGLKNSPYKTLDLFGNAGYSFADNRLNYTFKIEQFVDSKRRYGLDINIYDNLFRRDKPYIISNRGITYLAALFKSDYGDYFYSKGFEIGTSIGFGQLIFLRREVFVRPYYLRLFYKDQFESTANVNTNFSLFNWSQPFRSNPQINDGRMKSVGFQLALNYTPERRISNFGMFLSGEYSDSKLFSDFAFKQLYGEMNLRTSTMPLWKLDVKLTGGYSEGNVPIQRFFSTESSVANIVAGGALRGAKVKEFYGDRFACVSFEHNFGEVFPGMLRIPNIASFGIELIAFGNIAWTDFSNGAMNMIKQQELLTKTTTYSLDRYYYETGIGLNKLLLFFRFDITARISQYSVPRFMLNISGATD
ncbi:MAG: DUF5686 family protein [Candidatus Kapabacteria bacterium]|nr:DUF5686 family protein [Candidatus Kapabacteria bacterium]